MNRSAHSFFFDRLQKRQRHTGAALAILLMVVAIAVILAFTMAGTSVFHLNVAVHSDNASQARYLAESVVAMGIEKVIAKNDYGKSPEKPIKIFADNNPDGPMGILTFDRDEAARRNIPFSTNNLKNDVSIKGWNDQAVPNNSVHLLGTGKSKGITRTIEVIVHAPPFPYCIASQGKFISKGELIVASVGNAKDIANGLDKCTLFPGHLVSNNPEGDSVTLMSKGKITGDLQTSGDVKIDPDVKMEILGEIRRHSDPVNIPTIDISSYDPREKSGVQPMPDFLENPTLQGYCRAEKALNIAGDLCLNGSLLYVNGDLNIGGAVKGKGALVVTGKTSIGKGADLSTDNLVALLSKKDVAIGSPGSAGKSSFRGVIYTEGNFNADNMDLLGAFISRGENITIDNVNLVSVPEYSKVSFEIKTAYSINFHYADSSKYPLFKLTVKPNGRYEISYTPTDPGDDKYTGKVMSYTDSNKVVDFLTDWWTYCESKQIYGATFVTNGDCDWDRNDYQRDPKYNENAVKNRILDFLNSELEKAKPGLDLGQWGTKDIFTFDLSQFLNIEDRMQIILWRQL